LRLGAAIVDGIVQGLTLPLLFTSYFERAMAGVVIGRGTFAPKR
jgi:hypothetical protein